MQAACGELCIIHDDDLSRTTNGQGKVTATTYADIAQLDAGSWFSPQFGGEKVPRLSDAITCLATCQLGVNFEFKPVPGCEMAMAERAVAILNASWPEHLPAPLLSSFSVDCLRCLRSLDLQFPLGLLFAHWRKSWQAQADELACTSVHLSHNLISPERIQLIKQSKRLVLSYTINDSAKAKQFLMWGVDAVFSDYPDLLRNHDITST